MCYKGLIIFVLNLICITLIYSGNELEHGNREEHDGTVDSFDEILQLYSLNDETKFTVGVLQQLLHDFAAKIHCREEKHEENVEGLDECATNFNLNVSTILTSLDRDHNAFINEDLFDEISLILLEAVIRLNGCCRSDLLITNDTAHAQIDSLVDRLTGGSVTSGVKLVSVQNTLELIGIVADNTLDVDSHAHSEEDEHSENEAGESHTETEKDPHHNDLIREKCLGADILFDQLGLDIDEHVSIDNTGKIASLVVFHILNGAKVSRDCRILPRKEYFFGELDHIYGHGNKTLGRNGK